MGVCEGGVIEDRASGQSWHDLMRKMKGQLLDLFFCGVNEGLEEMEMVGCQGPRMVERQTGKGSVRLERTGETMCRPTQEAYIQANFGSRYLM